MITFVPHSVDVAPLPPPNDLGFGAKFTAWRSAQIQALDRVVASRARFVGIVAPCGFGKALFGMAATRLLPDVDRALYLTSTRGLQDQAERDFGGLGLIDVRGQQNYPCIALEPGSNLARYRNRRKLSATCEEGPCHVGVSCYHAPDPKLPGVEPYCKYYNRVWKAQRAGLVSTNYAYWLASANYGKGLGEFDVAVLDEAHNAIDELERFLVLDVTSEDVGRLESRLLPDVSPLLPAGADADTRAAIAEERIRVARVWRDWAAGHHHRLQGRLDHLERVPPTTAEAAADRQRLQQLAAKLDRLRQMEPDQWIVERDQPWRVRFSPLDVRAYTAGHLFGSIPKIILMSATLTEKTLDLLGIPASEREVYEFPSTFPVERRPVYAFDAAIEVRVGHKMTQQDQELWLERIDEWIDERRHTKGIIHCVSYERGKYLYEHSRHREQMIFHEKGDAQIAVDAFKLHEGGAILVSPSIMTGFDFPYDECRWQVIGKVPIPDNRGPIAQARIAADPDFSWYTAMQKLEQAVGRGMRAEDDACETLIADDTFGAWFFQRARPFATSHFIESVRFVPRCPPPLVLSA